MHAVVVRVTVNDVEASIKELRETVVPTVSHAPGFVAGYWTRRADSDKGLSMIVFESEENANEAVARIRSAAPEDVTVEDVEVREVVASA